MSIRSRKAGTQFGQPAVKHHGQLSDTEWCKVMLAVGFPADARVLAEGLAVLHNENGGSTVNFGQGASGHIGAWAESPTFGSVDQRLDSVDSTKAALKNWKENQAQSGSLYGNFEQAWGQWEAEQGGKSVQSEYHQYLATATAAIKGGSGSSSGGGWLNGIPDPGDAIEALGGAKDAVVSSADFLAEMGATLLDFRKLGQLAAEAFGWFIRLLLKAIWDYAIAPLFHWAERAVSWYWINFFSAGTERGSGVGYVLRQNAGIITIMFWALGYAMLWSDGEGLSPAEPQSSLLGQTVKSIEGKVARRNLIKPEKVKEETPTKPEPKASTVSIERVNEFSVARKRSVNVTPASGTESSTGRNENERSEREGRQTEATEENGKDRLVLPHGVERPQKNQSQSKVKAKVKAPRGSKPGSGSRTTSGAAA